MEKKYCVYVHTNKVNGKRYVGMTSRRPQDRWANGNGYKTNPHFDSAIKKYGWDGFTHKVIARGLSKEAACRKEIELISEWQTTNPSKGYNITLGGVGTDSVSDETRLKKSKQTKAYFEAHPEARDNAAEKTREYYRDPRMKEWKSSERKRFFAEHPEKKTTKPIIQYDLEGNYIRNFDSAVSAEKECGCNRKNISACLTGRQNSAEGYIWRYATHDAPMKIKGITRKSQKTKKRTEI